MTLPHLRMLHGVESQVVERERQSQKRRTVIGKEELNETTTNRKA
jgi:hypothetical protein